MDPNLGRGRSSFQGHNNQRSPTPSPHHFHDASPNLGLDPSVSPHTFTTGKFVAAQHFTTPYLESTHPQTSQPNTADPGFYSHNQFNHNAFQENQWPAQSLEPSYANSEYLFHPNSMNNIPGNFNNEYQNDNPLVNNQQSNVNPADLSSPLGPSSPNLLSPDSHASPPQPPSPASTQGHYYTPQHSRHQSLDPASAAFSPNEWQSMGPAFQGHRRVPSEQSEISSNSASPYLAQNEVFESIETRPSPFLPPQQDGSQTFGLDAFSIADQPHISPGHSPYISPRLLPQQNQGLGVSQEVMMAQHNLGQNNGGPGPEIYATQPEESYTDIPQMHNRNDLTISEMGQADQYVTPSINIEPAPVSRQASFEVDNRTFGDALQPPTRNRGRSKSDPHLRQPTSRSTSPAGRSPPSFETHSVRSHSPGLSVSRESSPGPGAGRPDKNRRSSTSSIPTRDYILDLADPSRPTANTSTTSNRVQKHPATFSCHLCPKRFTRAYNLRSHLRTHTDERPFVCTVCGKAFARQHDRKRHEGLHSGEKKFVCKGELGSGGQWGCGRRFARADALGRHFRSEAGRVCIKPLLDEEAAERERHRMMEEQQNQYPVGSLQPVQQQMTFGMDAAGVGGFALPAALLAQYPALNNIDWSAMPQGEDPGEMSDVGVGRSSFDGSSGGEYYGDEYGEDDIDKGYVSGNGMTYNHSGQAGAW